MTTQWTIAIDWNRDGDFTDTYDNITDRIISANWFLGMDEAYMDAADASSLMLTLNNSDRRYSPEYAASPLSGSLVPFRPVRMSNNGRVCQRLRAKVIHHETPNSLLE